MSGPQRETTECQTHWSECTFGFEQYNELGEIRKCTPVLNLTITFIMFIILLIVLFLFYKYK